MKEKRGRAEQKLFLSVVLGLIIGITAISFYFDYSFFYDGDFDLLLLCIFQISWILFLIFWNIKRSKLVYLLLIIPISYFIGFAVLEGIYRYDYYVYTIPRMPEQIDSLSRYQPHYRDDGPGWGKGPAMLDEESYLKMTDNLPILDGATAFYPLYSSFVQAVYPPGWYNLYDKDCIVLCSRTPNAYNNLLERKVDIIFCFEPSESQMEQFREKGLTLNLVPIGREAFVFFVNKKNSVNNLTVDGIKGIYSGRIKNWRRLGGALQSIRPFQRLPNSGSQTILEKIMGDIPIIKPKGETVVEYMIAVIYEVASYRNFGNAIGYSFLFYSTEMVQNDQIKLLSINGIFPSRETISNSSYPFSQNIYAIYIDDNNKKENIEPFIDWILSAQGQELVSKTGYIPVMGN